MSDLQLKYYDEFKKVLADYQVSDHARLVLKDLKLLLIMAATATGRSVVDSNLISSGDYYYIVSDTTRPPQVRGGKMEENGVQYYFKSEEEVLKGLKAGEYLEAELIHEQQVSGISIRELEKAKKSGKIAFTETDIEGVANIKRAKPDAVAVFLLPPSFPEWMERLKKRGGLTPEETIRRLRTAERFLAEAPKLDYFNLVTAGDEAETVGVIRGIMEGEANPQQAKNLKLVADLLKNLRDHLKNN